MVITPETRRTISSFRHIATSPLRRLLSRALAWDGHVVGLGGKGRDRANVGGTWARRGDTLSKLRTVRNIERVSVIICVNILHTSVHSSCTWHVLG